MAKEKKSSVLAEHSVQKLNDYQHSRIRTEMYLGSRVANVQDVLIFNENSFSIKTLTWVPALVTAFREIIDNSLDEFKKAGTKTPVLRVSFNESDLSFTISDNGRGIPIDYVPEFEMNLCTMVLTETKTGRNFDDSERNGVIGANGLGGSITMCVSSEAEIEIYRSGKPNKRDNGYDGIYKFTQVFKEGNDFFPELLIEPPTIRKVKADKTGTSISFKLSPEVFKCRELPTELVYSILKEIANANPEYKIYLNDQQIKTKGTTEKTLFPSQKISSLTVLDDGFKSTFYIVPNAVEEGMHMHGIVNNAPSFEGGSHLDTFKRAFPLGMIKALEKEAKKRKLKPNRSDVEEGLLIYNITEMNAPYFTSQTKTKLVNETVIKPIERDLNDDFYAEIIKKNKAWVDEIFERTSQRTNKKEADEDRKAAKKLLRSKVLKLIDAGEKIDRSKCKLLIAEGDSAISNLSGARDKNVHGILPLRGKIKNVSGKEKTADLMESLSLKDIMGSLNIVPGEKAKRSELRYGQLYICADEDEDGKNIAALVCNFLYKFWPELFNDPDNPFVYIFKTPFIILEKKNHPNVYFYSHNIDEYKPHEWSSYKATRAKGLGTLEIDNFKDALQNGFAIPITNEDGNLGDTLDLIFNKERSDDRKEWMDDK